jgi:hypothetical protein
MLLQKSDGVHGVHHTLIVLGGAPSLFSNYITWLKIIECRDQYSTVALHSCTERSLSWSLCNPPVGDISQFTWKRTLNIYPRKCNIPHYPTLLKNIF